MEYQEIANEIQNQVQLLRATLAKAELMACAAAEKDPAIGAVVAELAHASGHAAAIHGHTTAAGLAMPDVAPRFGGK